MVQTLFEQGDGVPNLKGQRCNNCGHIAFPPNPYGCEVCGMSGDVVTGVRLAGRGRLLAFATTNHANQRDIPVPYTVASIELEDGPVIRALMTGPTDDGLKPGDIVEAVIVADRAGSSAGATGRELRFQPVGAH